ncbi:hypothetical protein H4R19_006805, partial [Coemansia spiralis]
AGPLPRNPIRRAGHSDQTHAVHPPRQNRGPDRRLARPQAVPDGPCDTLQHNSPGQALVCCPRRAVHRRLFNAHPGGCARVYVWQQAGAPEPQDHHKAKLGRRPGGAGP